MPERADAATPIEELKQLMRAFVAEREWEKYHNPRNIACGVCVEAAELLEHFQWLTPEEAAAKAAHDAAFRHAVGEELADVLMYLMSLANAMDLDVATVVRAKMARNRQKYPAETYRGRYERPTKR